MLSRGFLASLPNEPFPPAFVRAVLIACAVVALALLYDGGAVL
jgi:hypothetical protein